LTQRLSGWDESQMPEAMMGIERSIAVKFMQPTTMLLLLLVVAIFGDLKVLDGFCLLCW